jgi:hypothetical protein
MNIMLGGADAEYSKGFQAFIQKLINNGSNHVLLGNQARSPEAAPFYSSAGVKVWVLSANYPTKDPASKSGLVKNGKSIVLLFAYKGARMILSADAVAATEDEIVKYYEQPVPGFLSSAALKVGHHGSETSSTEDYIKAILPDWIFISADTRQDYRLPRCTVINNIKAWTKLDTVSGLRHGPGGACKNGASQGHRGAAGANQTTGFARRAAIPGAIRAAPSTRCVRPAC